MDQMVNNIWLTCKLTWMLRTYRTCNSVVRFSNFEFYKKLLVGVTLLRVKPGITWTQLYIYIYSLSLFLLHSFFSSFSFSLIYSDSLYNLPPLLFFPLLFGIPKFIFQNTYLNFILSIDNDKSICNDLKQCSHQSHQKM